MKSLPEMTQVISPEMINEDFIYFCYGIQYTLWASTEKAKSISYEFKPLVGQSNSAMLKISNRNLICQELFIYKQRPTLPFTLSSQLSLL